MANVSPFSCPGGCACRRSCGELYCSERCRDAHAARCHDCLCVGAVGEAEALTDPLVRFKVVAVQSNEILLLAAEVVVAVLRGGDSSFRGFVQEPWDAVVLRAAALRGEAPADGAKDLAESLRDICAEAAPLLSAALASRGFGAREAARVDARWLARIIGMFEQNNVGVRRYHPLNDECRPCGVHLPVGGASALEGTALYATICCANHACDQSCDILYALPDEPDGDPDAATAPFGAPLEATLVARRAVKAGDELTIAYIETDAPRDARREALADYGFNCACARCEANDSESEWEDDDDDEATAASAGEPNGAQ